jgi:hypothetical protein
MKQKLVTVITPTIVKPELADAIKSINHSATDHLMVVDGNQHTAAFNRMILDIGYEPARMRMVFLDQNVGANGFYGHRIYASFPHLINTPYIIFLDEDNWFKPDHIDTMLATMETTPALDFAYSLRSIHDAQGNYLLDDNCESLGKWPTWASSRQIEPQYLIDTSSFIFKTQFLVRTAHLWHSGWGGDRRYLALIKQFANPKFECTGRHTLAYRLDGNPNSVKKEFFEQGNTYMKSVYGETLPWIK